MLSRQSTVLIHVRHGRVEQPGALGISRLHPKQTVIVGEWVFVHVRSVLGKGLIVRANRQVFTA